MTKVISFNSYLDKKRCNKRSPLLQTNPIGFSAISEGIKSLALKDREVIYKNVKYNYYSQYIQYVQLNQLVDGEYTFLDFIGNHLDLDNPFEILHGVDFSGEQSMSFLSKSDWENIADLVVRLSLSYYLEIAAEEITPLGFAHQYDWDYVLLDTN
ncbi:hypothetical protein [Alkaliphilus hydrothermalis]|uniref:Uncharacterized protein n=1 Tax=Alkaliphilus hydrothermalis TaxID=1482730 RepID=A0ABS2NS40_9FIRM|nr:hypothetical protein [Alkaliphilus hydrothermalis]MBM7615779.1 hypothetical protein [Alkaliphilus hydrothermalis]